MRPSKPASARRWLGWSALALLLAGPGCHRPGPAVTTPRSLPPVPAWTSERAMRLVAPERWPALLEVGSREALIAAVRESLAWLATEPPGRRFVFGPRTLLTGDLRAGLERFLVLLAEQPTASGLATRLRAEFELVESVAGSDANILIQGENGTGKVFSGVISRRESDYAWVTPDGQPRAIYLHCSQVDPKIWQRRRICCSE